MRNNSKRNLLKDYEYDDYLYRTKKERKSKKPKKFKKKAKDY